MRSNDTAKPSQEHDHAMHEFTPSSYHVLKACDAFTLDEARTILGDTATQGTATQPATSDGVTTDTCSYAADPDVTVTVRSALNKTAAKDEQHDFNHDHSADEMVDGFGEHAFYVTDRNELNIYDTNHWVVVSLSDVESDQAGLRLTKSIAEAIL